MQQYSTVLRCDCDCVVIVSKIGSLLCAHLSPNLSQDEHGHFGIRQTDSEHTTAVLLSSIYAWDFDTFIFSTVPSIPPPLFIRSPSGRFSSHFIVTIPAHGGKKEPQASTASCFSNQLDYFEPGSRIIVIQYSTVRTVRAVQ